MVDDREAVRQALKQAEAVIVPTRGLRFRTLGKTKEALAELAKKGLGG